jgi:hypothetical protein
VSATARELFVFSAFFATRSEHTSMTAATISTCFSYLHLHSRSAPGGRPRLVRLSKPLACSSWHHAFTILGSSRRPLGDLLYLFFLYLLSLGCTRHHWFHHLGAFFASLSSSILWLHHGAFYVRVFGFITIHLTSSTSRCAPLNSTDDLRSTSLSFNAATLASSFSLVFLPFFSVVSELSHSHRATAEGG